MDKKIKLSVKKRTTSLFIIFLLVLFLLSLRLFWIQVVNSEEYQNKAVEQRVRELQVEPKRGIIFDRNDKQLAASVSSQTVVAVPSEVVDPQSTARQLAGILDNDYQTIYNRITRSASAVYIERKIADHKVQQIRELDLAGITFTEESKRYYPGDNLASHIMGFAGIDSQGLEGIELSYDRYLRGSPGRIATERDAAGRSIPGGVEQFVAPEDGYDLYLTIDEVIQYIAERELEQGMKEYDISGGTMIVMDPREGNILALANRPDYDPNNFAEFTQQNWRNRAISDSFEPGSTFKIMTTAAALEEGVVTEHDMFHCSGQIRVSGETISCWNSGGHGSQTFAEVIENSCNPGFVQVGMRLGAETMYDYIDAFNFGQKTGIRLPGEAEGLITDVENVGPVELATTSFGHGLTVTPIQLISAVAAIANQGEYVRPRLVEEIRTAEGELVEEVENEPLKQVVSKETAQKTMTLLENVVKEGTGSNAAIEGYQIGGKTGTAKHYGQEVYDTSFIGVLPVDDPQLIILVVLYDVTGYPYYGSQNAAPMFRNAALDIIRYLDLSPGFTEAEDSAEDKKTREVPDLRGSRIYEAETQLRENNFNVNIVGHGNYVYGQTPVPGAAVKEDTTIVLYTEEDFEQRTDYYIGVPDLTSLTVEEAQKILAEIGLSLKTTGSGEIINQEITPGNRVPPGTEIEVIVN